MYKYANFNGYELNLAGKFQVLSVEVGDANLDIKKYSLSQSDGDNITSVQYRNKKIVVKGTVIASSITEMEQNIDTLNLYLRGTDKQLDLMVANAFRRYTGTLQGLKFDRTGYLARWEASFDCKPFGEDTASTALTFGTLTASPTSYANTIGGTYKTKSIIDLTINMLDPYWIAKYLQFYNAVTNQTLRITRIWNWFDRVVIDGVAKTVSLYETTKTVVDTCDVTTGWTGTNVTVSLEAVNMKEGVGAIKGVMSGAAAYCRFTKTGLTATDMSTGKFIVPVFIPTPTAGAVASVLIYTSSEATLVTNYSTYQKTTQWDGSAIQTNAWNFFLVDLAAAATSETGTNVKTAILTIAVRINGTDATMQLNGVLVDYLTIQKAGVTAEVIDYEGTFPDLEVGSTTLIESDEFTSRNVTITGTYKKRYI
jgi:hypothetical protein